MSERNDAGTVLVRAGYLPGCLGRITELHARHYSEAAGFGRAFEAGVAGGLAEFAQRLDDPCNGLWLAVQDDRVEGSIAIDGSGQHAHGAAHLRWFITSPAVRGSGAGSALLQAALDHGRTCGFESVVLWTFQGLAAARHLYEKAGFRLVHEAPGAQWGNTVLEQKFELRLQT